MEFENEEYKTNPDYDITLEKFFYPYIYTNKQNGTLTKAFAISNEKLPEIFEPLNLSGKKVATVGASGDQALNSILQGCKDVTIIDGNNYTKPFVEYKIALIKLFDYKTFNELFITPKMFDWKIYAKISHLLSPKSKQYWDALMIEQSENPQDAGILPKTIAKRMFFINENDKHSKFYKNKTVYNKLQSILNKNDIKISYIDAELKEFPKVLTEKYDLIFLSNIYCYYQDNLEEFKQIINKLYDNQLNKDGKMIINYEMDSNLSAVPKMFDKHKLEIQEFSRKVGKKKFKDTAWIVNKPSHKHEDICK